MYSPIPSGPVIDRKPLTSADEGQQIQMAYQHFLGRQASPEEIQNWLSGQYGHGQSGNLLPIFEAIRTSGEAQQRPPVNRPMPFPAFPGPRGPRSPMQGGGPPLPPGIQTLRSQGVPSAKPLGGQDVQRMRRAILGVPEY